MINDSRTHVTLFLDSKLDDIDDLLRDISMTAITISGENETRSQKPTRVTLFAQSRAYMPVYSAIAKIGDMVKTTKKSAKKKKSGRMGLRFGTNKITRLEESFEFTAFRNLKGDEYPSSVYIFPFSYHLFFF